MISESDDPPAIENWKPKKNEQKEKGAIYSRVIIKGMNYAWSTQLWKADSYLSLSVEQGTENQNSSISTGMKFQKCATINRV